MDLAPDLPEWTGWRITAQYLIAPDGQRITAERLRGLLWRDELELRRAGYASRRRAVQGRSAAAYTPRVRVVVIDLADYRANGLTVG
jgi:hypothetical protein